MKKIKVAFLVKEVDTESSYLKGKLDHPLMDYHFITVKDGGNDFEYLNTFDLLVTFGFFHKYERNWIGNKWNFKIVSMNHSISGPVFGNFYHHMLRKIFKGNIQNIMLS